MDCGSWSFPKTSFPHSSRHNHYRESYQSRASNRVRTSNESLETIEGSRRLLDSSWYVHVYVHALKYIDKYVCIEFKFVLLNIINIFCFLICISH